MLFCYVLILVITYRRFSKYFNNKKLGDITLLNDFIVLKVTK